MLTAEFVERLLAVAHPYGELPPYGSRKWESLTDGDPRRFASVVRAAECWRQDGTNEAIAARLRQELEDVDLYLRYRLSEGSRDVAAAFGELPFRPYGLAPIDELRRRRAALVGAVVA